ncbi:putative disease resistance protein RGA3 [Phoenix dactylifera]|uniref:Disease resistance protein RGA3 n=1 Tax=Phoenix dactylifera TaxID=42345 RepID=A0A8B9AD80_PHODC|nr:putative disease resistance protein RGA3 [Phoenix dactylifera]XP_038981894.1 putative disease resistance protein RGA3 [Phoenix dactylifera]
MAEGLTAGDWFGSAIIRRLVDDARSIEEAGHFDSKIQFMLRELQSTLGGIQGWINDAERGLTSDPAQSVLLRQLREAFYEADDLLDEFHFRTLSKKVWHIPSSSMLVLFCDVWGIPSSFMDFKNLVSFLRGRQNLKNLVGELKRISDHAKHNYVSVDHGRERIVRPETASFLLTSDIIGREEEKEEIVRVLLSSDGWYKGGAGSRRGRDIDVLPLVGIGGVGKTTLAQLVYNDERLAEHFFIRAWCYVSADFDIRRILKRLLCFLSNDLSDTISDMEPIIMKLKKAMSGKRFFVVFDDVWDESPAHWEMLRGILTCGEEGSKVLVTTRSAKVAHIMGTMSPIMVGGLSEYEFRALLQCSAFGYGNRDLEESKKLEPIGVQIYRELGGLPLAAKVLGFLLRTNVDEHIWRAISEGELWERDFFQRELLSTLKLSYQHLNANLRQCFSYCSIFPRGYMFEKHKLVQMWVAQGYIKLDDRREMILEDIGSQWFDELMQRFFFQPAEENRYVMHGLMHDLAVYISSGDCSVVEDESRNILRKVRHLRVRTDKLEVLTEMIKIKNLRTLLFFGDCDSHEFSKVLEGMFIYLKDLRVLDLSSTPIEKLPDSFGGLLHLRYLDISNTKIRLLPTSFSRLFHLQVLNLQGCHFQELPKGMNKLINLRYLYGDSEIVSLIEGIGELTNLHYIEEFPVRQKRGHGIGELENLMNLRRISIKNLENVKTKEEAKKAKLKNKRNLKALQLEWSSPTRNRLDVEEDVLEGLEPPPNLKELSITGYDGIALPGCLQSFTSLTLLMVSHYHHKTSISLSDLKALEKLHLEDCPELSIPGGLHSLANLKKLHIEGCPMLNESSLPKQPDMEKGLQSLTDLCIDDSILLNDGWVLLGSLSSLKILNFQHFNHLGYFSKEQELWFHQLTSIQELGISNCRSLGHLPADLSTLLSLKKLSITNCPKIMSLPENGLPISLEDLQISGCPELEERCSEGGPDWIKIARIPRVRVTAAVTMKT